MERCERSTRQLVELLKTKRVRDAFLAFAQWSPKQRQLPGAAQRAALKLAKHTEFFVQLEQCGEVTWTSEFLLSHFGTKTLRRYEAPVRWLQFHTGVTLLSEDKVREADSRRVKDKVATFTVGTVGRELLESFERELQLRLDAGRTTERSMRLAFQPAFALMKMEDPKGTRVPTQAAVERYLAETPGQRAALSTFLGFLKSRYHIVLQVPAKSKRSSAVVRKALEKQIIELMKRPVTEANMTKQWSLLALRYFHHMSAKDARTICDGSARRTVDGGLILCFGNEEYWIPAEPVAKDFNFIP